MLDHINLLAVGKALHQLDVSQLVTLQLAVRHGVRVAPLGGGGKPICLCL
jgi:hypothetical protein